VKREADDQHRRLGRDADRETLGEVVQPDRGGDRHAGAQRPRPCSGSGRAGLSEVGGEQDIGGPAGDPRQRALPSGALLEDAQPGAADGEPRPEQEREPDGVAERALAVLIALDGPLDDAEGVLQHVNEQEREHPDGEHRQRDAGARAERGQPAKGQTQEDREPGERTQRRRLSKGHRHSS
jgi:hypothetical protein